MNAGRRAVPLVALAFVVSCLACSHAAAQEEPPAFKVRMHRNIAYVTGPEADPQKHRLDVYQPVGAKGATVLMFVHGGAWKAGSKAFGTNFPQTFASRGIVAASINYRLSPQVEHPSHIRDVARAFDWIVKHAAEYGGNPDDVFISGHSAGGHLAALLATNPKYIEEVGRRKSDVRGVIGISGPYLVTSGGIFAGVFPKGTERDASPALFVARDEPPFLLLYGDDDMRFLGPLAEDFARRMRQVESSVEVYRIADRSHLTILSHVGTPGDDTTAKIAAFIAKHRRAGAR